MEFLKIADEVKEGRKERKINKLVSRVNQFSPHYHLRKRRTKPVEARQIPQLKASHRSKLFNLTSCALSYTDVRLTNNGGERREDKRTTKCEDNVKDG